MNIATQLKNMFRLIETYNKKNFLLNKIMQTKTQLDQDQGIS